MRFPWNQYGNLFAVFSLLFVAGCAEKQQETGTRLPPFSVSNDVVAGKSRQVLYMTNGISLYFTRTDLVVWFGKGSNSSIVLEFDAETKEPRNVLLKRPASDDQPAESVLDVNADGVPEIKMIEGQAKKQILYHGEWYAAEKKGLNSVITIDGNEIVVHFDGRRFVRVTN